MAHGSFRGRALFVCFLLFIWAGIATFTARATPDTTPAAPDWVFECAACPHNFYDLGPRSAQIDAAGIAHVVYGGEALYHAWESEEGWQVEIVEDGPGVGSQAALVIDGDGTMHIFYLDEGAQALLYAHGTTGAWMLETVATGIGDEPWPSPAVTATGELHVAFRDGAKNAIVHAWQNTGGWQFSTVDVDGQHPSLALDSDRRPHLSYVMAVPGELRYAYEDGGWQVTTVYTNTRSLQSALALDSAGQPHLAYAGPDPDAYWYGLRYAYRDIDGWHHEVVDSSELGNDLTGGVGYDVSMALDSNGRPHVAYLSSHYSVTPYPSRAYQLPRYATRTTDRWSVALLSEYGDTQKTALVLDSAGQPHVFYKQVGDLVRQFNTDTWQSDVVDPGGVAGVGASMAFDGNGMAHISYIGNPIDSFWRELLYTHRTSSGWDSKLIERSSGSATSLAVTPDGYPHILYNTYTRFLGDLAYIYRNPSGWNTGLVGDDSALYDIAVSENGQIHAVWRPYWHEGAAPPLYYTSLAAENPVAPEVIGIPDVRHASLATDAGGRPHVAYSAGGALLYAFRNEAGWHEEVVTSHTFDAGQVALALDAYGRPHIGFYAAASGDLFYATGDGGGWRLEQVDWAGDVGQYPAIAVSGSGQPHISYYDATNQDLKYARRDQTGWAVETVASEGNMGLYTSIAIYNGYPHIGYYDATRGDLMYVYKPFIPVAFSHLPLIAR